MSVLFDPAAEPLPCAPKPASEALRLQALRSYGILDTPREAAFEDITRLASIICQTPIALISLVDADRQWFKSERGMGERETPLFKSMCAHALLDNDVLVVPDTREDIRFARNPLVTGEVPLRFYAGALLKTSEGLSLGTVCVLDRQPRQLTDEQVEALRALARQTMAQLELRRALQTAEESDRYRSRLMAIAGHDLKTPLRTAAYAIDKMRRHANVDSVPTLVTARDAIGVVARSLDELATLAAASKSSTPDLQPLALEDVLHAVLGVWRQPASDKCLALRHVPTSLRVRQPRHAADHADRQPGRQRGQVHRTRTRTGRRAPPPRLCRGGNHRQRHRPEPGPPRTGVPGVSPGRPEQRRAGHRSMDRAPHCRNPGLRGGCAPAPGRRHLFLGTHPAGLSAAVRRA